MPDPIQKILVSPALTVLARVLLTFPFWASGLAKLMDFQGGVAEMAHFGLQPAAGYNIAVIIVQLTGALLIIFNRWAWFGAGALGVFTILTIPIVHHFWNMTEEPARTVAFHTAMEHIGTIGGLVLAAVLAARTSARRVIA